MIRNLLIDLDDTILDFGAAEEAAISKVFRSFGLEPTPALLSRYREINRSQWEAFEAGAITREQVLVRRFALLLGELGLSLDPGACEDLYRHYLGIGHWFIPGAPELLAYLQPRYRLYLASNGVAETQYSRLDSSGIRPFFREIFISETTGHHKPEKEYFDYCFARIPDFSREETMILGDSLTSDILGGLRAGIHTCWFNYRNRPPRPDIVPEHEIHDLMELKDLL